MGRQLEQADLFEGLVIVHFKALGLWYNMNHFRATGKRGFLFKAQAAMIYLITVPNVIFQLMFIFTVKMDIQGITLVYLVTVPSLILICKQTIFWVKMDGMCSLYECLREDFLNSRKSFQSQEIYRRTARLCNRLIALAWSGMILAEITWATLPGYDAGHGRKKPLSGWYPFPYWESPWYEMVYAYEAGGIILWCGCHYLMYECAILMPLFCLCGHFRVLAHQITAIKKKEGLDNTCLNQQLFGVFKDFEKLISFCLSCKVATFAATSLLILIIIGCAICRFHLYKLYWFGDKLKEVYNVLISILMTIAIANVTVIVLHLIFEDKDYIFLVKTGSFLFFHVIELSLICLGSSMVETASSDIHHALYCNDWYLADKKFATTTQMMMIRASKPLTLTVMKTYPVNLETLLSIFQFIYSTAAVLSKTK